MTCLRFILALICFLPVAASAQSIENCDWRATPDAIPEPWEDHTRTFANGEVRVAVIDIIEPAAIPYYLMILHPPRDEMGARRCTLIGFSEGTGYQVLYLQELESGYDPEKGLTLALPGRLYDPEFSFSNALILNVTINQTTGKITANHELGYD